LEALFMPEKAEFDKPSSGNAVGSRLSLAAKLYSIFALFAVLTAAITLLSDYNTRGTHGSHRDCEPLRTQCRACQFAGLCRRDGIAGHLYVDGTRRREEVW
jgi:hypothetical protein